MTPRTYAAVRPWLVTRRWRVVLALLKAREVWQLNLRRVQAMAREDDRARLMTTPVSGSWPSSRRSTRRTGSRSSPNGPGPFRLTRPGSDQSGETDYASRISKIEPKRQSRTLARRPTSRLTRPVRGSDLKAWEQRRQARPASPWPASWVLHRQASSSPTISRHGDGRLKHRKGKPFGRASSAHPGVASRDDGERQDRNLECSTPSDCARSIGVLNHYRQRTRADCGQTVADIGTKLIELTLDGPHEDQISYCPTAGAYDPH